MTSWYLDVVLRYLRSPVFEPLGEASFRLLSMKTVFLLSLATAKRVSEIQALSSSVGWQRVDAVLSYVPSFRAKTESSSNPLPRHVVVKDLSSLVGMEPERFLCPVRALRYYLERTKDRRGLGDRLFVSTLDLSKPISKAFISRLIKELILSAHREVDEADLPIFRVRAHDVRGVAASVALLRNVALADILASACWRTSSVFVSRYLKGIAVRYGDQSSLGPLVAAGSVCVPSV